MDCPIQRDDRGATAIEYAFIAAMIGIGLIGSLVETKTSLSAIFGTAGSQMASSGAAGADAQAPVLSSLFAGKTFTGVTKPNAKTSAFAFSDGTMAYISTAIGASDRDTQLVVIDPAARTITSMYVDPNGNVTMYEKDLMTADMSRATGAHYFNNGLYSPKMTQAPYEVVQIYNTSGFVTSTTTNSVPTAAFSAGVTSYISDYTAFMNAGGYKMPF